MNEESGSGKLYEANDSIIPVLKSINLVFITRSDTAYTPAVQKVLEALKTNRVSK